MNNVYFKASLQNTLNPEVGTFDNVGNKEGTFTLEDGEYYLTNNTSDSYRVYYPTENINSVGFTIEFDVKYRHDYNFRWILLFNGSTYWHGFGVDEYFLQFRGSSLSERTLIGEPGRNRWLHVKCIFDYDHNQNNVHIYIDNVEVNNFVVSKDYDIKNINILGNDVGFVSEAKIKNIIIYKNKEPYLDTTGLTSVWSKIKSLFATKTELASKANDSDVVHKSGDETIAGTKTFISTGSDSGLTASNSSTEHSLLFGIGSTGVNRGIYDKKNKRWSVYLNDTDYIMTQCPTPPVGDSSNKLATTGWVQNELDSTCVQTTAVDQTIAGTKTFSKPIVGSVTGSSGSCTGNAATATKATQDSDGNKITTTYSKVGHTHDDRYYTETEVNNLLNGKANNSEVVHKSGDETIAGTKTFSSNIVGNVTGNASTATTATKLAAARTIALSGAVTGTATAFDGSGNITIPVTALAASSIRVQWYAAYPNGPEAHNAMWGGRDITDAFNNGTVSAKIANGTFRDIFPGDYITKQVTIPRVLADDGTTELFAGGTYTVNWVVADCDYWWHKGDQGNGMETHHVVIVPQAPIFKANMNATNTTEGGYKGSEMYKNVIPACATGIVNAFGSSHILTFRDLIVTNINASGISLGNSSWLGVSASAKWVDAQCNLIGEHMVYGHSVWSSGGENQMIQTRQFSAFRLGERLINYNRQWWWLRDVVSSAIFAVVDGTGCASTYVASTALGVRPFALLI